MVETLITQILFLATFAVLGLLLAKIPHIDTSLGCLITGVIAGISLPFLHVDTGIRASNIYDLIFMVILPVLVFSAAWQIEPKRITRWIVPILFLATFGVLIVCFIIAVGVYTLIDHPGFPFAAALLLGSILAATDPVSVVDALERNHAPKDLTTIIEGESLFNDATAVVLFTIVLSVITTTDATSQFTETGYISYFVKVFLGGIIIGSIIGLVSAILALILKHAPSTTLLLVFAAFGSFYIAEHILHVSGIMAVMFAALVSRALLNEHKEKLLTGISSTWEWLGLLFKSLLFVIMGLLINFNMFIQQWLAIFYVIVIALISRFALIYILKFFNRFSVHKIKPEWNLIFSFGGLRGAIAIALTLSLPNDLPYLWTIQSMVFGLVIFTLIIQGPITSHLISKLDKEKD